MKKNLLILITSKIGFIALAIQMYITINRKLAEGFSLHYALNHYYSYFTIIINTLVAAFLFVFYVAPDSKIAKYFKKNTTNGALCLYILIVGIIYYVLLYPTHPVVGLESVASHSMHGYVPLAYTYLWYTHLSDRNLQYRDTLKWLTLPLCYFVYLIIRGEIVGKYPYFFVDVARFGYVKVLIFAVAILMFFVLLGALLVFVDKRRLSKNSTSK